MFMKTDLAISREHNLAVLIEASEKLANTVNRSDLNPVFTPVAVRDQALEVLQLVAAIKASGPAPAKVA